MSKLKNIIECYYKEQEDRSTKSLVSQVFDDMLESCMSDTCEITTPEYTYTVTKTSKKTYVVNRK